MMLMIFWQIKYGISMKIYLIWQATSYHFIEDKALIDIEVHNDLLHWDMTLGIDYHGITSLVISYLREFRSTGESTTMISNILYML